jgi:hypothetical protein
MYGFLKDLAKIIAYFIRAKNHRVLAVILGKGTSYTEPLD